MLSSGQDNCFSNLNQEFLICTTIHKARQLANFNGATVVNVSLDKTHHATKSFPNSENPYFNEYFVFELKCTLTELLRLTILYEVKKRTPCKKCISLGELLIDLQTVWNQPNRCYFKKWGRLEGTVGSSSEAGDNGRGYLQIDLAIVSQATNPSNLLRPPEADILNKWQINQDYDDIENNLLLNNDSVVQSNIRYSVTFCRGYLAKKSDYFIQGKTNVSKATIQPEWNQEVSFAWTYPSLAQTFLIQLLSHEHLQWKCIGEYELHFDEIAFKDKPSLGPTFLHLYDSLNSHYVGRLLVGVRSESLAAGPTREVLTRTVAPIDEQRWWQDEVFMIEFLALQGDFVHGNVSNCKLSLKMAEHTSNNVECYLKTYQTKRKAKCNLKYFRQDLPYKAIALKATLPDNRHKYESDFFIQEVVDYMKTEIETFKLFQLKYTNQFQMQIKCLKALIMSTHNKLKEGIDSKHLEYTSFKYLTPWDSNRLTYLQDFFNKLAVELLSMRHKLNTAREDYIENTMEEVLQTLVNRSNELTRILASTRIQDEWPNLMIMLSVSGNKDVAVCRLNAKYFSNPAKDRSGSANNLCWRMRNFVFKDINCLHTCCNCGCIVAIIRGCLGIVVENERKTHLASIAQDWQQTENFYWNPTVAYTMFKCRIFIHQAKVRPGHDRSGLCDAHLRVFFGAQTAESPTKHATLSPIWNMVICFEGIAMPGSIQWYMQNPPLVAVELHDTDKMTADDYLGCGMLAVSVSRGDKVEENASEEPESARRYSENGRMVKTKNALQKFQHLKTLSPPPLKWLPITSKGSVRAELLMAAELVEVNGEVNTNVEIESTISFGIPAGIQPNMRNYVLETVFVGFRNYGKGGLSESSSLGGRHRIKIMMGDLVLTSGLSSTRIKNSINFLVLYASGVVSLPEQLEYWPAIIATDLAVSARGAESTIGAVLISNCRRFLQRDRQVKCKHVKEADRASSIGSTTVHFEDEAETSPLISKTSKANVLTRITSVFVSKVKNRVHRHAAPPKLDFENKNHTMTESDFNWWTKFYNSLHTDVSDELQNFKHKLIIYPNELEKQVEFNYLHDWAEPVQLVHGLKHKKNMKPKEEVYATLKLNIRISPCQCGAGDCGDGAKLRPLASALHPKYQSQLQSLAELCRIVARVYVVQGIQFRPHDKHSQSDSYVKVQLGTKSSCNRAGYVANQSNPIFGKCFQLEGVLPGDHMMEVSVFDRNTIRDEIIGSTFIDLEDRWRTKHRATVGIAHEYSKVGYNKWRDLTGPYEILSDLCAKRDIKAPAFFGSTIEVDGVVFADDTQIAKDEPLQERLSLIVLRKLDELPSFGYKLVPEHVETRSLFRTDCPGIEQGKIQLWIELFEGNVNIPPVIDITPQPPQIYELRVIICNCSDITLDEKNIFGKRMSDIFIKGWCHDAEQVQSTDIHYRSLNGEGNFNWRMIFPLKYSNIDDMMVIKRKGGLLETYETKQPPILYLQVWDNDIVSPDDFLGALEINLSNFRTPFADRSSCKSEEGGNSSRKPMNLFRQKIVKGWFPLRGPRKQKSVSNYKLDMATTHMAGKLELKLEILDESEAATNPAGLGRSPPNALASPVRPDTSFNPLLHPLKSFSKILWPVMGKSLLFIVLVIFGVCIVFAIISGLPSKFLDLG